ncbi:ISLre2 family transposase [Clostridium thermosuccinogenes]|jgi:hypothetical protein|nr:ISLre2 family transposase [Pseudoclostridium thermosuccinogenes]AUS96610.1 hypothetical protein CDO33_09265 [Pseudoclostridium thermosuccinogenes]AUS97276.1 hypothetical protein CDO33_13015 [Pseudoclostridium thermosuccinogenes]AUS97488.1 hypothetical protein CDO33_14200 [Pseudoclostridium thermosuccinogenes]AUS97571.1 hypothetical protein CDO33_14640 [Pseudoclostridium thermosuccinogenes]AUS98054.1 hypothetical protein CDO33_17325 [Pseudoclostridium thermosuccinogenes]
MYNSIQHFIGFGVKKIEEKVKKFVEKPTDLADLVLGLHEELLELGRNIVTEVLEDMDDYLRESASRKQNWEIVRKDRTGLLTSFGPISYERTYFKPKKGGKRQYLVDRIVGINPHDRVSADVVINAVEEAAESSYRKGGEKAAYMDEVSKQAVMNKVHELEVVQPSVEKRKDETPKILYIEADEDHVAQQGKKRHKTEDEWGASSTLMPKLVYVHEGIDHEKSTKKRKVLKNPRYFGGIRDSEELWLEVSQYIDDTYDVDKIETVYISGDGAAWIKQGLNWIGKSKFVLDKYHLSKYVKVATAHLEDEDIEQELDDALKEADKAGLKKAFAKILEKTESETKRKAVNDAKRYILNNWAGIEIKVDNYEIVGCSAEGHVSHILSDRLSSRPMGWSKNGADKMAQLRIFKKNGGKVYDLVMAQKKKEQREQAQQLQDELIRELRTNRNRYDGVWDSNLTIISKGHKTLLYRALRAFVG